jgi:hypothetical protein
LRTHCPPARQVVEVINAPAVDPTSPITRIGVSATPGWDKLGFADPSIAGEGKTLFARIRRRGLEPGDV